MPASIIMRAARKGRDVSRTAMTESLIIKNTSIITMDASNRIYEGDVVVEGGRIVELGQRLAAKADFAIDGRGRALVPGFVQTHIHLCQTLFRGAADDLALIDWLKKRIWPMEAAHTPD